MQDLCEISDFKLKDLLLATRSRENPPLVQQLELIEILQLETMEGKSVRQILPVTPQIQIETGQITTQPQNHLDVQSKVSDDQARCSDVKTKTSDGKFCSQEVNGQPEAESFLQHQQTSAPLTHVAD